MMLGEKKIKKVVQTVLSVSGADEREVVIIASQMGLTRFANNQIHQHLERKNISVNVRVVKDKKIGVVSGNLNLWSEHLPKNGLKKIVNKALAIAKIQKSDPFFKSLPGPARCCKIVSFFPKTADFSAKDRAGAVARVINLAIKNKLLAFGAIQAGVNEFAVANSQGVFSYFPETFAGLNITMMKGDQSGYASDVSPAVERLNSEEIAQKSARKALFKGPKIELPPGKYEVVLEPAAVNEMLIYLAYLGFGARAFHESRSFLSGKLGKKVMGSNITIWDDALDTAGFPAPFDFEGVPKRKVCLIEKGVAKNVVYDSYLAGRYGKKSTGHGLLAPNTVDAIAGHLHLSSGKESASKLISQVKKGILVTRFWYTNAHHHNLVITGLTRDGTFLIKNGKLVCPIKDLRFTQSIPEAFYRVIGLSKEVEIQESWVGANFVPWLRISDFNFTGISKL